MSPSVTASSMMTYFSKTSVHQSFPSRVTNLMLGCLLGSKRFNTPTPYVRRDRRTFTTVGSNPNKTAPGKNRKKVYADLINTATSILPSNQQRSEIGIQSIPRNLLPKNIYLIRFDYLCLMDFVLKQMFNLYSIGLLPVKIHVY